MWQQRKTRSQRAVVQPSRLPKSWVICVFRKAGASPGEIESFLAEAVADGGGNWAVIYPSPIPRGTMVAASQTTLVRGTSEFALSETTALGSGGSTGSTDGSSEGARGGVPQTPDRDTTPPQTVIVSGPNKNSPSRNAQFRFISSDSNSRFSCKLDQRSIGDCRSPQTYKRLRSGRHVFRVWSVDIAGNKDQSPAKHKFRIVLQD